MPYCTGDYFFFLSQDDFIDNDLFEKCLNKAIETGADIVLPNVVLYYGDDRNKKNSFKYPLNNNYNSFLSPKDSFELSLTWKIHGNSFRNMELVRKIGIKAKYYNSCEYATRKSYLYANKITFADTNFYYRQNNPNAITKNIKYFYIDILTTDIMLFELLIENEYSKKIIRKHLRRLKYSYYYYNMILYFNRYGKLSEKEFIYVKQSLNNAKLKISRFSYKYLYFCLLEDLFFRIKGFAKCIFKSLVYKIKNI